MKNLSLSLSLVTLSSLVLCNFASAGDIVLRREMKIRGVTKTILAKLSGQPSTRQPKDFTFSNNPMMAEIQITESRHETKMNGDVPARDAAGNYMVRDVEVTAKQKIEYPGEDQVEIEAALKAIKRDPHAKKTNLSFLADDAISNPTVRDYIIVDGREIEVQFAGTIGKNGELVDIQHENAQSIVSMLNKLSELKP